MRDKRDEAEENNAVHEIRTYFPYSLGVSEGKLPLWFLYLDYSFRYPWGSA